MAFTREAGTVHPGISWGPFTARIPFLHTRPEWPDLLQGIFVAGATGLEIEPERIFTSAMATAQFLQMQKREGTAYVVG